MTASKSTEIQAFYEDCSVFITGGTGTLGKLTIEKILRSCPAVRKIYVLIRPKKGLSVEQRKKLLLDNVVFDRMKLEQPDSVDKIVFVAGDCSEPRLGLSDSDYHHLNQHVNIVLHLAATVRFDEDLKRAVAINVGGTQEALQLCHDCVFLKAAVFVSTAYSNCIFNEVEERFYDPPMQSEDLHALIDRLTATELEVLCPKIIGAWPNTYVFSKAMSENIVFREAKGLPVSIVRPSMVVPTFREPIPGWIDNIYGLIALAVGSGVGVLRVGYGRSEHIIDQIPADMVTNCILAAALTPRKRNNANIIIYNIGTSDNNPITLREFQEILELLVEEKPLKPSLWYPFTITVADYKLYMVLAFLLHFLPGCLLDFGLRLLGKPPMLLKVYRKIKKYSLLIEYFSRRNMIFVANNTRKLYKELESKDQEVFLFNTNLINWRTYVRESAVESRKYMLNGFLSSEDNNRTHFRRLYIIHTIAKMILFGSIFWLIFSLLKPYKDYFFNVQNSSIFSCFNNV